MTQPPPRVTKHPEDKHTCHHQGLNGAHVVDRLPNGLLAFNELAGQLRKRKEQRRKRGRERTRLAGAAHPTNRLSGTEEPPRFQGALGAHKQTISHWPFETKKRRRVYILR